MTLILTELTHHGIAMATDSTLTAIDAAGDAHAIPNGTQKLHLIPHLSAGLSLWGLGQIDGQFTDQWITTFIQNHTLTASIEDFANTLAAQLNALVGPDAGGDGRLGFHIAGFVDHNGTPTPTFYHVHDGPSTELQQRNIVIDPTQFNANHDVPPDIAQHHIAAGGYTMRNGDFQLYAHMFQELERFFINLRQQGIIIPNSNNLRDLAEYLVFQLRTVAEVYRLSNLVPGIGGAIQYLTITPAGIQDYGTRDY